MVYKVISFLHSHDIKGKRLKREGRPEQGNGENQ